LRRHAGLVLACVGLFLLSLSNKIYAGHRLLLEFPAPSWIVELRATGRMFWPVSYAALIVGALILCRRFKRPWVGVLLLVLATLQYIESSPIRRWIRRVYKPQYEWTLNPAEFRPLLAHNKKLMVWPTFGCGGDQNRPVFSHLFLLASEVAIPVNTTYTGRLSVIPKCNLPEFPITVKADEMWVFVPNATPVTVMSVVNWRDLCRQIDTVVVCAQDLRGRTDLPLPNVPMIPTGTTLSTAAGGAGDQALVSGWGSGSEIWGVWSEGSEAELIGNIPRPSGKALTFTAMARGVPPSNEQKVTVIADGIPVATWDVKPGDGEYTATIPPASRPDQPVMIEFRFDNPFNPPWLANREVWFRNDRKVGMGLVAFRFDVPPGNKR
jgi:hypothetical protein